jgi:signal transduction histidine kinase
MKRPGPSLFRQIATRLAFLTLVFAVLNIAIVLMTYSRLPEALAEEMLTLEANRISSHGQQPGSERQTTSSSQWTDASQWTVRYIDHPAVHVVNHANQPAPSDLIDWTQRERTPNGYRITGLRTVVENGTPRWLYLKFEGDGLRPYIPVILDEIWQHVALPLVPLAALMLAFNILAVRRVLNPLRRAEREADDLDPDNMALRLSEPWAPREVHTLVCAFNRALGRLESAIETLRAFTANAAHELRTPLSIMQLGIDRLPESGDRDALSRDNLYMTRLVGQMLDLAQADDLTIDESHQVDLADIARSVVTALAPRAFEQNRDLRFEHVGAAFALGHNEAIFRIIRNLIDNALAHSDEASPVEVVAGPGPVISVRDYGPGIPEADRAFIFERFWRGDRRASNGAGLGLGIVQRLVKAHNGAITIEDAAGGGTIFSVRFQPPA